jgi:caa(3)-type oxidase subunit IV
MHAGGHRIYWTIWVILLALTVTMLVLDRAPMPRGLFVAAVVAAMLVKAMLIAGYFMHLRFERPPLVAGVVIGLFLNGLILFVLIAPDAARILRMSGQP